MRLRRARTHAWRGKKVACSCSLPASADRLSDRPGVSTAWSSACSTHATTPRTPYPIVVGTLQLDASLEPIRTCKTSMTFCVAFDGSLVRTHARTCGRTMQRKDGTGSSARSDKNDLLPSRMASRSPGRWLSCLEHPGLEARLGRCTALATGVRGGSADSDGWPANKTKGKEIRTEERVHSASSNRVVHSQFLEALSEARSRFSWPTHPATLAASQGSLDDRRRAVAACHQEIVFRRYQLGRSGFALQPRYVLTRTPPLGSSRLAIFVHLRCTAAPTLGPRCDFS